MDKRAFLVLGPASSGTRLMTQLLLACGCYGDAGHEQGLDDAMPENEPLIAWRRSLPHRNEWPQVPELLGRLMGHQYKVTAIIMSRDWHSMAQSQVQAGHALNTTVARAHIRRAYLSIFRAINVQYEIVNYEALVQRPQAFTAAFCERYSLTLSEEDLPAWIYDGNEKYYAV